MRLHRQAVACSLCWVLVSVASLRAEPLPPALLLVPPQADVLVIAEHPRATADTLANLKILHQLRALDAVREFYDSTNYRRFLQLVAYFEKQLGAASPDLLERLAGRGAVVAAKLGPQPAPTLLVLQGTDPELTRRFFDLALQVADQELARSEARSRPEKGAYRNIETVRIGKEFHAAAAGPNLLVSNVEKGLQHAIDLFLDHGKSMADVPEVAEGRALFKDPPAGWLWLNMKTVHQAPQAKEVFALPRNDVNLTVLFGGWLDVAGRSPFLCAGLSAGADGLRASVRLPRGREGMPEALAVHLPPPGAGALPLLEPQGVLYSSSYFFDLGKLLEFRTKLFNDKQLKSFDEFDKNSGRFLGGKRFSELAAQAGGHHRIVVAQQGRPPYKTAPTQRIPAFAFVIDMRDPAFGKSLDSVLRAAALLASFQFNLKLVEEKENDVTIVGYRFPEKPYADGKDPNNIRLNFTPCFARAGGQFIAASTLELGHELVGLVQKEAKEKKAGSPTAVLSQVYGAGAVDLLKDQEDQLFAQTVLTQALSPEKAKEQVGLALNFVRQLGVLRTEVEYGAKDFRYEIRLVPDQK